MAHKLRDEAMAELLEEVVRERDELRKKFAEAESTFDLFCPLEYETATVIWDESGVEDHCAGCGRPASEHLLPHDFRLKAEDAIDQLAELSPPAIEPGARLIVDHPRYHGEAIAAKEPRWENSCIGNYGAGWFVACLLENGSVWWYEADTVELAAAEKGGGEG